MTKLTTALVHEFRAARESGAGGRRFQAILPMNRCLGLQDSIVSGNGMFHARLSEDGVFRVLRGADAASERGCLWDSRRAGPGGRFFALVQSDGNFCVYRGDDLSANQGWQWGTQMTADGGQFYAVLRDNGEFSICRGSGPTNFGGVVWSTGVTDPVRAIDEVVRIDYDLDGAEIVQSRPSDLYRETVRNNSAQAQTSLITGSVTVSDTAGWQDELGSAAACSLEIKSRIPIMVDGKVILTAEAAHPFTRNGATTTAKTWGFNAPAAVQANSSMMCLVSAMRTTITVPYTMSGLFTLESGVQVSGTIGGTYTGANCHDLAVTLTTFDLGPDESYSVTRPLSPMPLIIGPSTQHPANASSYF
ncbi:hypothetical protein E4L96_14200 [Massilia arenosa]|uniref:Bulb-type lectin domain-containing protein n=1 Tax=Zemynaea arenosa TaxID=2561931 RepID=A0A4Y9SBI6_9BURK|nr:hypothetical protein [Massilia arenosa]TFW17586.1 hypothetical protein E4L96_14200 [Massilia arenosa]